MALTEAQFSDENNALIHSAQRVVLAYSGGLDSTVLLYLLASNIEHKRLLIWHVNHQLQKNANDMESFCQLQTQQYQLSFKSTRLDLSQLQSNIEAQARKARYAVFTKGLSSTDVLLTAHHADDQLETVLLNLSRGSGVLGLRGIAKELKIESMNCYRPLLHYTHDELLEFAEQKNLVWMDDPSNALDCFDRNFIRHKITPQLKLRWPSIVQSFSQVCAHQKEAAECLEELATSDFKQCCNDNEFSTRKTLLIAKLKALSTARQKNLLRYWFNLYAVSMSSRQFELLMNLIKVNALEYKRVELKAQSVALFKEELFLVFTSDIVLPKKVQAWLESQKERYVGRLNKEQMQVSSHFLKHQFQAFNVPPWLREQTLFKLDKEGSRHSLKMLVL